MKALRVGSEFYVNADDVEIIQSYPSRPARREKGAAQERGCFYDASGGKRILSVVTLKNGWVIATPFTPSRLVQRPTVAAPTRESLKNSAPSARARLEARRLELLEAGATPADFPQSLEELFSRENSSHPDTKSQSDESVSSEQTAEPSQTRARRRLFSRK